MASYEDIYKTICRVCLIQNNAENMVSLTENSSDDGLSSFGKSITILTNVSLRKDDNLPNVMCQKCVFLLKQAIYFKLKCESSDQKLKILVKQDSNKNMSEESIKEIVCEYVMYDHYFPYNSELESSKNTLGRKNCCKIINLSQKQDEKNCREKIELDSNMASNVYNFGDILDNDDLSDHFNDNKMESNQNIDNILNTLQDFKTEQNIGTNQIMYTKRMKKKLKREQRYHTEMSSNERNLICKICNRILANRVTYNHHMQRHNNCRYMCDQCGKGFPILNEMHMHQVARHGIGPYLQCDHCPYKAPRKVNLIEHLRLHTGERPFTCEKCGLTFRRRAIWRNHLVCHMEKKYQCSYCPRKFFRHCQMLAHCNNVHKRLYMYMCNVCNVTYTKTETVRRHMIVKHGIPREKQGRIVKISSNEFPEK